jgi:ribonuclease BN (tRNA processing enzyme)
VKNFAIGVSAEGRKYCYSGDGDFNSHTRNLYHGCNLLVHEAYSFEREVHGHVMIPRLLEMAREERVQRLALTHIQRDVRKTKRTEIEQLAKEYGVEIFIPEPGEICQV